jgi:hypothetical protein
MYTYSGSVRGVRGGRHPTVKVYQYIVIAIS